MVTCQSSELGWEVTVELPADFLSLGRGSVINDQLKRDQELTKLMEIREKEMEQNLL